LTRQKWEHKRIFARRKWEPVEDEPGEYAAGSRFEFQDDERNSIDDFSSHLKKLGEEGWELVAVVPLSNYVGAPQILNRFDHELAGFTSHCTYYFKRPQEE
jgi:hypothetical protein